MEVSIFEIFILIISLTFVFLEYIYLNRMSKKMDRVIAIVEEFDKEVDLSDVLNEFPDTDPMTDEGMGNG
jgi:hypothetical protein